MTKSQGIFIAFGILFFLFIGCAVYFNENYNLNKIKSKTVGDGQYGTARFATDKEVHQSLKYIEFDSVKWRKGIDLPKSQGLVVGSKINLGKTFGYVDSLILFRCFFMNGAFGIAFGWLYRKYGIQYSMLAHFGCHFVSKLIWLLFI